MNKLLLPVVLLGCVSLAGCQSSGGNVALGALGGAAAGAGGYELHLNKQREIVEADFKAGKIDQRERDIRINQIERDSLLQ